MKRGNENGAVPRSDKLFKSVLAVGVILAGFLAIAAPVAGAGDSYVIDKGGGSVLQVDIVRDGGRATAVPSLVIDPRLVEAERRRCENAARDFRPPAGGEAKETLAAGTKVAATDGIVSLAGQIRNSLRNSRGSSMRDRSVALLNVLKTAASVEREP